MKISRILLLFFLLVSLCGCQQKVITFVQYNVGVFNKYRDSSIEVVADAIKEMGADVVTLNEIDSCTTRTGKVDQLAVFSECMGGWNYHYASAMSYKGGAYGVGVASSPFLEVLSADEVSLPIFSGSEPRAMAVVEYDDFILCSAHLDYIDDAPREQVKVINHYVDSVYADCTKPIFLAGDFNSVPGSETIELVRQTWVQLTPEKYSYPSHAPDRCIDYIFVRPNGKDVSVKRVDIPTTLNSVNLSTASDHLPVVLTVLIKR